MSSQSTHTVRTLVFRWMALLGLSAILLAMSAFLYGRYTLSQQLDQRMERVLAAQRRAHVGHVRQDQRQ